MSDTSIIQLIQNPKSLNEEVLHSLSLLIDKYPYFNTAYLLKARTLKNINSSEYKNFLTLAAVYALNRKKLYDFLHTSYGEEVITEKEPAKIEQVVEEHEEDTVDEVISIEEKKPDREIIQETAVEKEEDELDQIIDYTKTIKTEELKTHIADAVKRQVDEIKNSNKNDLKIIDPLYEPVIPVSKPEEKNIENKLYRDSYFEDDLLELDMGQVGKDEKIESNIENKVEQSNNVVDQKTLIDNFIKSDPRIKVSENDKFDYEDISESSVREHDNYFTDTLAKIYIKQGNYTKAIFAYEKLILKYPEKKAYFASQIENIRRKINN